MSGSPQASGHVPLAWPPGLYSVYSSADLSPERGLFTTHALLLLGYRVASEGRYSYVRDCAWFRFPDIDHHHLPFFKVDFFEVSEEFFKGSNHGTEEQIALNAMFLEWARRHDEEQLLDLDSAKIVVCQGAFPKAQALHILKALPSTQIHSFNLHVPLPELDDLDLPPVGILPALAIFDGSGRLCHVHLFITHGSFAKCKRGERSIVDLVRGIGMVSSGLAGLTLGLCHFGTFYPISNLIRNTASDIRGVSGITIDHLCLPIFKIDYMALSGAFYKGKNVGTADQIALNALFIEMARDFDQKHLLDLSSAKLIVSQGGFSKAQALHIYSKLHSTQVHKFDLFIPLPDLEDLDLPPVGTVSAVAIFNTEGLLRHVHVFITHGSFSKYKKGERSILDLIRGIGMDYVMLSHSILCLNTPSEYAWGQYSALLIPSGGGENIGEGFNGLTMWLSSLNVGDKALSLKGDERMAHAVTVENLPISYRIYMVRMGLSNEDVKEWDVGTVGRSWLSRLHGRCNSIVQYQTQTKQQLSIRGLKAAETRKRMADADPGGYVEFMERRSAKFRDTMSKISADVRAKKIKEALQPTTIIPLEGAPLAGFNRLADMTEVVKAAKRSQGNKG